MKKSKLLGWAFMVLATITSCSEDTDVLSQETEIKLTSKVLYTGEIIPSRVTSLDYQSTQIVEGQQIGVTITGAKSEHSNVAWKVGENGALNNTGDKVYYGAGTATITAYHPFNFEWTGTSHSFSVSPDQSIEENYRNSDLLWAKATSTKTDAAVPLKFTHKLAKINVNLTSEIEGMNLSGATISICNTKISVTFDPTTGVISDVIGEPQEIKAGVTTAEAYTTSAIVVPQTVNSGSQFIKIALGEKTYYYTLSADKVLQPGYSHNYTLILKEQKVEVQTESKITNWTDEEETIGNAEEVSTIIPYITFTADANQTLKMSRAVETLEYSVNGGDWKTLGTSQVTFGGNNGALRLRGKSSIGTYVSTIRDCKLNCVSKEKYY